jgi:hypothetical protein
MNIIARKTFSPIAIVFLIFAISIALASKFLEVHGFATEVLMIANTFLFFISIGGFILQRKGLQSDNPNAFVRGVYASMMFKMFVTMFAVLIYAYLLRSKINKPGLFTAMGMYIVYTVVEVSTLMKVARKKKNA